VAANVDAMIDAIALGGTRPAVGAPAAVTVRATAFDLSRALSGRRSESQLRRLDWSADPDPFLPLFGSPPFSIRATDLDE
jgi:hypothetical protein